MKNALSFCISFALILPLCAQNIDIITPNSSQQGKRLSVDISGQNTTFDQGTTTVWFQQGTSTTIYPDNVFINSATSLTATFTISINADTGFYDVNVENSYDGLMTDTGGFYILYNPDRPVIISANPDSAKQGQTLKVSISGQNTNFTQGTNTAIWFQQGTSTITPYSFNIVSSTLIEANFSFTASHPTGFYDVGIYNSIDDVVIKAGGFLLQAFSECTAYFYIDSIVPVTNNNVLHIINSSSGNAPFSYLWTFGDGNTSTLPYPQNSYAQYGAYEVCLTVSDNFGCSDTYCDTLGLDSNGNVLRGGFTLQVDSAGATSIRKNGKSPVTRVYPNPFTTLLEVDLTLPHQDKPSVEVMDLTGRVVFYKSYELNAGENHINIDLKNTPPGIYFVRLKTSDQESILKLVKQ